MNSTPLRLLSIVLEVSGGRAAFVTWCAEGTSERFAQMFRKDMGQGLVQFKSDEPLDSVMTTVRKRDEKVYLVVDWDRWRVDRFWGEIHEANALVFSTTVMETLMNRPWQDFEWNGTHIHTLHCLTGKSFYVDSVAGRHVITGFNGSISERMEDADHVVLSGEEDLDTAVRVHEAKTLIAPRWIASLRASLEDFVLYEMIVREVNGGLEDYPASPLEGLRIINFGSLPEGLVKRVVELGAEFTDSYALRPVVIGTNGKLVGAADTDAEIQNIRQAGLTVVDSVWIRKCCDVQKLIHPAGDLVPVVPLLKPKLARSLDRLVIRVKNNVPGAVELKSKLVALGVVVVDETVGRVDLVVRADVVKSPIDPLRHITPHCINARIGERCVHPVCDFHHTPLYIPDAVAEALRGENFLVIANREQTLYVQHCVEAMGGRVTTTVDGGKGKIVWDGVWQESNILEKISRYGLNVFTSSFVLDKADSEKRTRSSEYLRRVERQNERWIMVEVTVSRPNTPPPQVTSSTRVERKRSLANTEEDVPAQESSSQAYSRFCVKVLAPCLENEHCRSIWNSYVAMEQSPPPGTSHFAQVWQGLAKPGQTVTLVHGSFLLATPSDDSREEDLERKRKAAALRILGALQNCYLVTFGVETLIVNRQDGLELIERSSTRRLILADVIYKADVFKFSFRVYSTIIDDIFSHRPILPPILAEPQVRIRCREERHRDNCVCKAKKKELTRDNVMMVWSSHGHENEEEDNDEVPVVVRLANGKSFVRTLVGAAEETHAEEDLHTFVSAKLDAMNREGEEKRPVTFSCASCPPSFDPDRVAHLATKPSDARCSLCKSFLVAFVVFDSEACNLGIPYQY